MENQLPAVSQAAAPALDYNDPRLIATIKATVAKGFTDPELAMFIGHCKGTGLNPFKREIWGIKASDKVQILTGINGYYEIANRHPAFDGIEVEVVEDGKQIIKAVARVYRKDRSRPAVAEAYMAEYGKSYGNWKTMPRLMLSKCAESMALRKSFPQELNGTYTDAEMPREYSEVETFVETKMPQESAKPAPLQAQSATEPGTNGTPKPPRKMPANERLEPELSPDLYKLEAPKSCHRGKTLAEIHAADKAWIGATLANPKRRAGCTKRDVANLEAFWGVMGTPAPTAPSAAFEAALDEAEADGIFDVRG